MGATDKGHHVMFAMGGEGNIAHQHQIVIAFDLFEDAIKDGGRIFLIAFEKLAKGFGNAFGRVNQAFPFRIVTGPADQGADGLFCLFAGRAFDRLQWAGRMGSF